MAVVLTIVQTRQIKINIPNRNNTQNTVQTIQKTVNTSIHSNKTRTHYKTHTYTHAHITKPTHTHTHTLQNKVKQPQYKLKRTQYRRLKFVIYFKTHIFIYKCLYVIFCRRFSSCVQSQYSIQLIHYIFSCLCLLFWRKLTAETGAHKYTKFAQYNVLQFSSFWDRFWKFLILTSFHSREVFSSLVTHVPLLIQVPEVETGCCCSLWKKTSVGKKQFLAP